MHVALKVVGILAATAAVACVAMAVVVMLSLS